MSEIRGPGRHDPQDASDAAAAKDFIPYLLAPGPFLPRAFQKQILQLDFLVIHQRRRTADGAIATRGSGEEGADETFLEFREVGFGDVEADDVDLDAEEGDFADAEAEELVFFAFG